MDQEIEVVGNTAADELEADLEASGEVKPVIRFPSGLVLDECPGVKGVALQRVVVYTVMCLDSTSRTEVYARFMQRPHAEAFVKKADSKNRYTIQEVTVEVFVSNDGRIARLIGPEVYTQDQDELKKQALAKLTPQERRALGIYDTGIG